MNSDPIQSRTTDEKKGRLPGKLSTLLARHPQLRSSECEEIETLQPFFSSVVPSGIGSSLKLQEFWVTCLQMSSCHANTLWRQSIQIRKEFVSTEGCESLCVSQVLLHPSLCYNIQCKQSLPSCTRQIKVIAAPGEITNGNNYSLVQSVAKVLAELWASKETNVFSQNQQPHSNYQATPTALPSHTSSARGTSVASTVSWVAAILLSKLDLMDDPDDAQEIQDAAALLEKDMNQLSIGSNHSSKKIITSNDDSSKAPGVVLLSVDLVCQCCQLIVEYLPRFWNDAAESQKELRFYSYYYNNTSRPKLFLFKDENEQREMLSFWKFCQYVGSRVESEHDEESSSLDYFNLVTAVPHTLSKLAVHDSDLLFSVLSYFGRIQTSFCTKNSVAENLVLLKEDNNSHIDDDLQEVDAAIFHLTRAQWEIEERIAALNKQYNVWGARAVEYSSRNRQIAINMLKRRKMVDLQIEKDRQLFFKLEQTKLHLEQSYFNKLVIDALQHSHVSMKNIKMDLENVEDAMLDLEEDMKYADELTTFSLAPNTEYLLLDEVDFDSISLGIQPEPTATVGLENNKEKITNDNIATSDPTQGEYCFGHDNSNTDNERNKEIAHFPSDEITFGPVKSATPEGPLTDPILSKDVPKPSNELISG